MTRYLIVPGWSDSGPDHWQSHWQRTLATASRVEMPDWFNPKRDAWVTTLDQAIREAPEPPVLVAHSLGCIAVVHWAQRATGRVRGAFLVSPPDFEGPNIPPEAKPFAPPTDPLPFPSMVVASTTDPLVSVDRAQGFAADWGSDFKLAGDAGHINAASGHGPWPEGLLMFAALMKRLRA